MNKYIFKFKCLHKNITIQSFIKVFLKIFLDEFTDSVVIQPISMKPSVIPTFLYKNINDNVQF